jgi:hypothetical protein
MESEVHMGLMNEYIGKRMDTSQLELELRSLIQLYNQHRKTYLFVYASALNKPNIPDIAINQDDYYLIHDILRDKTHINKIDVYLETPGGSGEAAEEIVELLRSKYENVSFVVSGEAKSAGTIMVLSGDEILMTETGSLGPIDAQIRIGRAMASAYDYKEWVEEKQSEALKNGKLNPFDAVMVAQISPGELKGVYHSLKFAEDLVVKWLKQYKFKNWNKTKSRGIVVTEEMKEHRAKEIVNELINHSKWRSHGRSIKIDDLENLKLTIIKIDEDLKLKDIVYRIQTVSRLLFTMSSTYKIFVTQDEKIFKSAVGSNIPVKVPKIPSSPDVVQLGINCEKCGKKYNIYAKLINNPIIDRDLSKQGFSPFPKNNKIVCECGYELDLGGIRNDIEVKSGKRIVV